MKELTITARESGQRLDKYLKRILPNASAGFLYKMLRKKNITLNGAKAAGSELLTDGDSVRLFLADETILKFSGNKDELQREREALEALPMRGLKVIYEDEDILAADKPCGMLSQKAKDEDVSANECLLGYLIRSGAYTPADTPFRPSVCNRLDRNTTGLILMGKTLKGSQMLSGALRERTIGKYYLAVVAGRVEQGVRLSGYLLKDELHNQVQVLKEKREGASPIETEYRPLVCGGDCSLLEVHLITGKTHQIRAHLASVGHPVIGDLKYGDERVNRNMRRSFHVEHQLLHAYRIELADGRKISAAPPDIFERLTGYTDWEK